MAWLRSAVSRAVEVGGNSNLTRTFRSYADTVVHQAGQAAQVVAGGAKMIQDRVGARNLQSFKQAVKRLEEVSVSYRGIERVQLLRRWLVAIKEIEKLSTVVDEPLSTERGGWPFYASNEAKDSPRKPTLVMYYDSEIGGEPMNFREVFLHSQALEGMTLSMILEAPNEEEVTLLREIFGLCLTGGKEVHDATLRSIQDLARSFTSYDDEVLAKREELLQFAQGAIAGLKINANIVRIDSEISDIRRNLDEMRALLSLSEGGEKRPDTTTAEREEALKEALAQVQLCSRLHALTLQKKHLNSGDSPEIHAEKVDKLRVLSESLASSVIKTEKRIAEQRVQKEEALNYRITKTSEVSSLEKDLEVEIEALEKQKNELEVELRKVNNSLASARARIHIAKEEREQFDVASKQILQHFKLREEELSRSIVAYRKEEVVCSTFINFLDESWAFQSSYNEQKKKQVNDELERYEDYFMNLALRLLSTFKDELGSCILTIRKVVEELNRLERAVGVNNNQIDAINPRKRLEDEYLNTEGKCITILSIVESIKKQFRTQDAEMSRKNDHRVKEIFNALDKIKLDFDSLERPTLEVETPVKRLETPLQGPNSLFVTPKQTGTEKQVSENETKGGTPKANTQKADPPIRRLPSHLRLNTSRLDLKQDKILSPSGKGKKSDPQAELSKLKLELELEDHTEGYCPEEIGDWEFES